MNKKIVGLVLIIVGILLMVLPLGGSAPALKCAEDVPGEIPQLSGVVDPEQNNCAVTLESYQEYRDYETGPKPFRIAGLVVTVTGVGVAASGLKRKQ